MNKFLEEMEKHIEVEYDGDVHYGLSGRELGKILYKLKSEFPYRDPDPDEDFFQTCLKLIRDRHCWFCNWFRVPTEGRKNEPSLL